MNPYILIGISIVLTTTSQLLFKGGVNAHGPFQITDIFSLLREIITNKMIVGGMITLGMSFIVWILALSKLNLSAAYPLTSINFILISVLSALVLKESITPQQIVGTGLITLGIIALFQH